jgi:hypothetical protein
VSDEARARRLAENEALFRVVNERIEEVNRAFATLTETMDVVCECGAIECTERLLLGVPDYERVRSEPTLFVIVPGHQIEDVEDVVEEGDGWMVVQKSKSPGIETARATDPRS